MCCSTVFFYPNGAMRPTAKTDLLNLIKIKCFLLPPLMRDPDLGATVMGFMAILESIDYRKFEIFFNVADEISSKSFSSFLVCEVLVVVLERCDFKFSIKAGKKF